MQLVPTQWASTDCLWVIQVSDQIAVGQCMLIMNVILQSNLFNTESKGTEPIVRFTEVYINYRGRECIFFGISGSKEEGGGEGEVGTPNRSHYQYPVLRCDPVFGWNFLFSIPGFPQFSPFRNPEGSPCSIHKH